MSRCAVLVGIDAYARQPLRHAVEDMSACHAALERIGFRRVVQCINVDKNRFEERLSTFEKDVKNHDNFILFNFNGHCKLVRGRPTLIFRDGEELEDGQLPVEDVVDRLMTSSCSQTAEILLLMNCCRSGEVECEDLGERSHWQRKNGRNGRNASDRCLSIIWACALGRLAADSDGDASQGCNSFMQGFLECVEQEKTLKQVYDKISETVQDYESRRSGYRLRQKPWFSTNSISDRSDFFLPNPDGTRVHWAPNTFLACSALHLLMWCTSWIHQGILQRSGWTFNLTVISFFWSAFSYNQHGQSTQELKILSMSWPEIEKVAIKWWLPICVTLAQGFADHLGQDRPTHQVCIHLCITAFMTHKAKPIPWRMFEEWHKEASRSCRMLGRAWFIWFWIFLATCFQIIYAQYKLDAATADVHWPIVLGLVLTSAYHPTPLRKSNAFQLVVIGYTISTLQKVLSSLGNQRFASFSLDCNILFCCAVAMLGRTIAPLFASSSASQIQRASWETTEQVGP